MQPSFVMPMTPLVTSVVSTNPPIHTLYVRNLPEKMKIHRLKETLMALFIKHGKVLNIHTKRHLKMRGQAFVAFETVEEATKAAKELQYYPVGNKPMMIQFARFESDDLIEKKRADLLESHKRKRAADKEERRNNHPPKKLLRLKNPKIAPLLAPGDVGNEAPNTILFVQNLPPNLKTEILERMFAEFPGFKEIRIVTGREGIAFVEYDNVLGSSAARVSVNGRIMFGDNGEEYNIRINFAKK